MIFRILITQIQSEKFFNNTLPLNHIFLQIYKNMLFPTSNALRLSFDAMHKRRPSLKKRYDKLAHNYFHVYLLVSHYL